MMRPIYLFKLKSFLCFVPVVVLLLLLTTSVGAQNTNDRAITGVVQAPDGETLPGVTIKVKGNEKISTVTDQNGKYRIKVPAANSILIFSYVGFLPKEVSTEGTLSVNVSMQSSNNSLSEVVVIGYGTVKRPDLTGSVASVNMADMEKAPVKSIDDALAGRLAGVQVVSTDGQPGGTTNIKIRGANSITGDNSPLYVVDGFPIEGFDLNTLAPADVESIDVLKDASSTAIYGARGANGVIMITTKRGRVGDPVVQYDMHYGIQHDIHRIETLSPYEFVKLQLEISPSLYGAEYTTNLGKTLEDYRNVAPIDWYSMVFRGGSQQNHNLSVSGGTAKTRYSVSGSIFNQDGIIINSGYKRYQGKATLDQNINDQFKVGVSVSYSSTKTFGTQANANGGYASFMPNLWGYRPIQVDPTIDITTQLQDPDIGNAPPRTNPFLQAQNDYRVIWGSPVLANAYADYAITKDLHFKVTGGLVKADNETDLFANSLTRAGANIVGSVLGINGSVTNSKVTTLTNENILSYNKHVGNHTFGAVGVYSVQTVNRSSFGATGIYLPNESLGISGLDEGTAYSITSSSGSNSLLSYLARVNYSYKSKYLLTASMRADGSSKFPPKNKWGYFPSGAIAYRISDERFMKNLTFISNAKIRATYGATGNNRSSSDYPYFPGLSFVNNGYSFGNAVPSTGAVVTGIANPDLKWETTTQADIGLDLELFKGRISLTADYYDKTTSDLLLNANLPITTGYGTTVKNIGKVSNSGLEFTLSTVNVSNSKFQWSSSFNISFNKNKVLALTENQEALQSFVSSNAQPYYIAKVGQPIAQFYGLIYNGVYQYSDFDKTTAGAYVLKSNVPSSSTAANRVNIRPGDIKFIDLNNDGITNAFDYTVIGDPNPDFIGGFTNNFRYKGFDLNVFFQFSYGNQIMDNNILTFENGSVANTNQFAAYANRWTPTNTDTDIPRAGGATTNFNYSRAIKDGSYLAFKTASLGYTLPKGVLSKLRIKNIRVYTSAQNIFVITNYPGSDPDVSVRDSPLTPGFDYSSYPPSRVFVFGASVTF
jgi:TonB-dependent starch-binding outer membrane protein SusC